MLSNRLWPLSTERLEITVYLLFRVGYTTMLDRVVMEAEAIHEGCVQGLAM